MRKQTITKLRLTPVAALLLVAAACSDGSEATDPTGSDHTATTGGETTTDPAAALAAAAEATLAESTMSFDLEFGVDSGDLHDDGQLEGRGDFAAQGAKSGPRAEVWSPTPCSTVTISG